MYHARSSSIAATIGGNLKGRLASRKRRVARGRLAVPAVRVSAEHYRYDQQVQRAGRRLLKYQHRIGAMALQRVLCCFWEQAAKGSALLSRREPARGRAGRGGCAGVYAATQGMVAKLGDGVTAFGAALESGAGFTAAFSAGLTAAFGEKRRARYSARLKASKTAISTVGDVRPQCRCGRRSSGRCSTEKG